MKIYYLPIRQADRIIWLNNFLAKLTIYATLFNVTAGELTLLGDMVAYYTGLINQLSGMRANMKDWNQYKDDFCDAPLGSTLGTAPTITLTLPTTPTQSGLWEFVFSLANRAKATLPGYTEAIGKELRIVGAESDFDQATAKTKLTVRFTANFVEVGFTIPPEVTGVKIMSRRAEETVFTFLATDSHPPYHDNRSNLISGKPEKREYQAWFYIDENIIGLESDVVSIVVNIP